MGWILSDPAGRRGAIGSGRVCQMSDIRMYPALWKMLVSSEKIGGGWGCPLHAYQDVEWRVTPVYKKWSNKRLFYVIG